MRRMLLIILAAALVLSGCGGPDRQDIRDARDAINRTDRMPASFIYTEDTAEVSYRVEGEIEDDFRYRARLSIDGEPAFEEIVSDDALYVRILSAAGLDQYVTDLSGADDELLTALVSGRWVRDPLGAPSLVGVSLAEREVGEDPVFDALTYLGRLDDVILNENTAVKFDRHDFEYFPQRDPFPTPDEGSDVIRYDVRPLDLPKSSDRTETGNQQVPQANHFRKLGIYVRDGVVFQVLESIDVAGRLDDIRRNYDLELSGSEEEQVALSVRAINAVRRGQGDDPIRVRDSSLELVDPGTPVTVEVPTEHVVDGDLSLLRGRGRDSRREGSGERA